MDRWQRSLGVMAFMTVCGALICSLPAMAWYPEWEAEPDATMNAPDPLSHRDVAPDEMVWWEFGMFDADTQISPNQLSARDELWTWSITSLTGGGVVQWQDDSGFDPIMSYTAPNYTDPGWIGVLTVQAENDGTIYARRDDNMYVVVRAYAW